MNQRALSPALLLIIGIPLASVVFGGVMFYLAHNDDAAIPIAKSQPVEHAPLSKTSWRGSERP